MCGSPVGERTELLESLFGGGLLGRLEVGRAVAKEARRGNRLREDNADGDEDRSAAGSKGNGNFDASAFWILIAAAKGDAAFREIFTDSDFFLEAAAADASKDPGFNASAVATRENAVVLMRGRKAANL